MTSRSGPRSCTPQLYLSRHRLLLESGVRAGPVLPDGSTASAKRVPTRCRGVEKVAMSSQEAAPRPLYGNINIPVVLDGLVISRVAAKQHYERNRRITKAG